MQIVDFTGFRGLWAFKWAWRFVGVEVGVALCWNKLALRKKNKLALHRNLKNYEYRDMPYLISLESACLIQTY